MAKTKKTGKSGKKRRKHAGPAPRGASPGTAHPQAARFSRFDTERVNLKVGKLIEGKSFKDMDELNSFVNKAMNDGTLDARESWPEGMDDPVEAAQELAFQSMEEDNDRKALDLARKALSLAPDCVDARVVEIQITVDDADKRVNACKNLLAQAREKMGREFFEENRGHFWGVVTTRPYMRALEYLTHLLMSMERYDEAGAVMEEMIDLNPNDNQGVRDTLLGLYLERAMC